MGEAMNVSEAASSGDHLKLLYALRDRVAAAVSDEGTPPRDLASLTRRLQDIAEKIDTLEERERLEDGQHDSGGSTSGEGWTPDSV